MIPLRPYQNELILKLRKELLNNKKRICCVLGCGGGRQICYTGQYS